MKDNNYLNILQYNVRNDRVTTMIPLLADAATKKFDIIAVQEPWHNPHMATTLSSHQSGFHLLYRPGGDTRVCFYVSDKIKLDSWEVELPSADLCTLSMQLRTGEETVTVHIHNVYNPGPGSYSSTTCLSILPMARQQISKKVGEYILLGDFNLHHPFWSGPTWPTQHAAADALLDLIDDFDLSLTLPAGTITWKARGSTSTIDLVFMTRGLVDRLVQCGAAPELNQSSDHIPVVTCLTLESELMVKPRRKAWKLIDMDKLRAAQRGAPVIRYPTTKAEVDHQLKAVKAFLQGVIAVAVPWAKPSNYAKPFWSNACSEAVKEARACRRNWTATGLQEDWISYAKANAVKKKVIHKAKTCHFRQEITNATNTPQSLWRLSEWAKDKSQTAREVPKMPTLKKNGRTAETFEEKADMLRSKFFPAPPPADLNDIPNSIYPQSKECRMIITPEEVLQTIRHTSADKAPGPDGIPNRILKVCANKLVGLLTPLFQACIDLSYHPSEFKMANTLAIKKPGTGDYTEPKAYRPIALLNTLGKVLESIMSKKICFLTESHCLLPETHMGTWRGKSTETALELLTEQMLRVNPGCYNYKVNHKVDRQRCIDHQRHISMSHIFANY